MISSYKSRLCRQVDPGSIIFGWGHIDDGCLSSPLTTPHFAVAVHPDHHFLDGPRTTSGKLPCKYLPLNLHNLSTHTHYLRIWFIFQTLPDTWFNAEPSSIWGLYGFDGHPRPRTVELYKQSSACMCCNLAPQPIVFKVLSR